MRDIQSGFFASFGQPWRRGSTVEADIHTIRISYWKRYHGGEPEEKITERLALLIALGSYRTDDEGYETTAIQELLGERETQRKRAEIIKQFTKEAQP